LAATLAYDTLLEDEKSHGKAIEPNDVLLVAMLLPRTTTPPPYSRPATAAPTKRTVVIANDFVRQTDTSHPLENGTFNAGS